MPPRPTLHRYPSTSSPTYTPPPCPYAGCSLSLTTSHTHYYPAIYDSSVESGPCPWPNCAQVAIHSHRYYPSGTNHTPPSPDSSFSISAYLLTHPELKAQLDADAACDRQETRLRIAQMAAREKQKSKMQRPHFFRDPSWSGERDDDEVRGEGENWGLKGGVAITVDAGKREGEGDGEGERGGVRGIGAEGIKMGKFRPVARPRLLERRHTLAGMEVVGDI